MPSTNLLATGRVTGASVSKHAPERCRVCVLFWELTAVRVCDAAPSIMFRHQARLHMDGKPLQP